jgi:hypothetical protein
MFKTKFSGAFESGHYKGKGVTGAQIDYHQIEISRHAQKLEDDYRIAREEFGMTSFRDGAVMKNTFLSSNMYDFSYLDKLAEVSKGQTFLALCHYEWPSWITEEQILNGEVVELMRQYAEAVAKRYKGKFAGYYPAVEITYWINNLTREGVWWPAFGPNHHVTWQHMYDIVLNIFIAMAEAIKKEDSEAKIVMSEPWNWREGSHFAEFIRPFKDTLHLLDSVGLNFYTEYAFNHGFPLHEILLEARRQFPEKEIHIAETSFGYEPHLYTAETWAELIDKEVQIANSKGANISSVFWAPLIDYFGEGGDPMPGGLIWIENGDTSYQRHWNSNLAKRFRGEQ